MYQEEQIMIVQAIVNKQDSAIYLDMVSLEDFDYLPAKESLRVIKSFYRQYSIIPTKDFIINNVQDTVREPVKEILNKDLSHQEFTVCAHTLSQYLRKRHLTEFLRDLATEVEQNELDSAERLVSSYVPLGMVFEGGTYVLRDSKRLLSNALEEVDFVPTLIPSLDTLIGGGFTAGDLVVIIGLTGEGKTTFLCHLAKASAWMRKKPVFITMEMSEVEVSRRILSSFTGENLLSRIEGSYDVAKVRKILNYAQQVCDDILVKHFVAGTKLGDIMSYVKYLKNTIRPKVILIDYADLIRGHVYEEKRLELEGIFRNLKSLAQETETIIATPSQANRLAREAKIVDIQHVAESFSKVTIADVVLSIEKRASGNELSLRVLKNRKGPTAKDLVLEIDWSTGIIREKQDE